MDSILLHTATVKGTAYAVVIDTDTDTARVSSKSEPGRSHVLTQDGCDCTYAQYHPTRPCAHQQALTAVYQARRQD